jgi:hypothetical protein
VRRQLSRGSWRVREKAKEKKKARRKERKHSLNNRRMAREKVTLK